MICPIDVPNIRDRIFEHVGPHHVRRLRLVSHDWNRSAVGALDATGGCRIRVTPENIDEYASFRLERGVAAVACTRLRIAVDFGPAPTRAQFRHLMDVVTTKLCVGTADGKGSSECVDKITFHGADVSFDVGLAEWGDLLQLLQVTAPGLRSLNLFNRNWLVAEGTFLHWQHFGGKLAFPVLEELTYCCQRPTKFLFLPAVAPALTKVQLTFQDADEFSLGSSVEWNLKSLQNCSRLTELTLDLDMRTSAYIICYYKGRHDTVRRLCLRIFQCRNYRNGLYGQFIARLFPEVRSLDLRYDSAVGSEPESGLCFPFWLGPLPHLEALGYGWLAPGSGSTWVLLYGPDVQPPHNFPALRSVATDLGFELSWIRPEVPPMEERLQFLTVRRLQLRLSEAPTLTENELQRHAASLHGLHPHVTCLAFDLESSDAASKARTARSIEILVLEFRGFEELEILGCDVHVGELLQELIAEASAGAALQLVRRLKVELRPDVERTAPEADRVAALNSVRMTLDNFPRLESAEVDGVFVVGRSVKAFDLRCRGNPSLQD